MPVARSVLGILNSATLLDRVRPLQTRGLFGARDFDKYVFHVPFPTYDPRNSNHQVLTEVVRQAEQVARKVDLSAVTRFTVARTRVREALSATGLASELEQAVSRILPHV